MLITNINADFFKSLSSQSNIHKPVVDMMFKSKLLSRALGVQGRFISCVVTCLQTSSDAIVLRCLLKMLQFMHQYHASARQFVLDYDLYNIVKKIALEEGKVLVNQMANKLLKDFQLSTLT